MHPSEYDIECLKKVKSIIDVDISMHFTIGYLAQKAGMGETKLKILFRIYYGSGIFTYLRRKRMEKAVYLITNTNKTIKEIAKVSGFNYYSNFITAFHSFYGTTPNAYRQRLKKNGN